MWDCEVEYSRSAWFGLCDMVDDTVGGVSDWNRLALRHKYQVEGVRLPTCETRQQRTIRSQSVLSDDRSAHLLESGFDWQFSVVVMLLLSPDGEPTAV